jgi:hypothetical protein
MSQPLRALLVRSGNTLYLAHTIDVPLPPEVYRELTRHMEFTHVRHLRGEDARGLPRGQRVKVERRRCYDYDGHGCLACSSGYHDLVMEQLQALGYQVRYIDDSARFPQNTPWEWDRLKGRFTFRPRQEEALKVIEAAYRQRRGGVIDAAAGFGKAQPLDAAVQTPQGPVRMGDLVVGSVISHPSGGTTEVVAIHPQGEKEIYRITFQDDSTVECCADHLWEVFSDRGQRRVVDTDYLLRHHRRPNGRLTFSVALPEPLKLHGRRRRGRLISPYMLGILLGDGALTSNVPRFTTADVQIADRVGCEVPAPYRLRRDGEYGYIVTRPQLGTPKTENSYRRELRRLGVWHLGSPEKFIPVEYLYGPIADRWELLRGLLDTDGEVTRQGAVVYSTSSPRLCHDVQWLVESLGGIARIKTRPRLKGGFHYRLGIRLADPRKAFAVARKRDRVIPRTKYFPKRFIANVEPIGVRPCQCITVAAEDGLYLTDHCVVTHNSELFPAIAMMLPESRILICVKSCDNVHKTIANLRYYLPPATIGQRGAGGFAEGRVTVTTAASVGACGYDWDLFLGDEAHELLADTYVADIIHHTPEAIRYGFTATVTGRSDNADARMEVVFGRTIFHLPYPEAVGLRLVVPIAVHWHRVELDRNPCAGFQDDVARERHGIWRNKVRNRIIAEAMMEHFESREQSLILVHKIEHALYLKQLLPEFTLCYGNLPVEDERLYSQQGLLPDDYQPLTVGIRKQLREDFMAGKIRGAIATGVWRLGVSFNQLAALCWAGAGSSPIDATQGPSRVSRINGLGKEIGIVHDLVDEWDDRYYNQSISRRRTYKKHDWAQVEPPGAFAARTGVGQYF